MGQTIFLALPACGSDVHCRGEVVATRFPAEKRPLIRGWPARRGCNKGTVTGVGHTQADTPIGNTLKSRAKQNCAIPFSVRLQPAVGVCSAGCFAHPYTHSKPIDCLSYRAVLVSGCASTSWLGDTHRCLRAGRKLVESFRVANWWNFCLS